MDSNYDFLVIGGGIAGLGAASHLSKHGKTCVLEQESSLGYHSSGRSAAVFIKNYGNQQLKKLTAASEDFFNNPEGIADHSLLSPRGEMLVATEDELQNLENYLSDSVGIDRLTAKEACELVPILREEKIVAAAIERDTQDIDSDLLLQGFARLTKQQGSHIATNQQVQAVSFKDGIWTVKAATDTFHSPIIVNAAGAWADQIANLAGLNKIGLVPHRRSIAVIPGPHGYDTKSWPLFTGAGETWYAKPQGEKLYVSPADQDPVEPHDAWADEMVLAEGLYRFEQMVTMPVTQVEHSWAGLRNFVKDKSPVVGFDQETEGFFWLAGQGGNGIQTSPALSKLACDIITAKEIDLALSEALSPNRLR